MEYKRQDLIQKREHYRTKMFKIMLEIVFIFAIPAVLAFFAYSYLNKAGFPTIVAFIPLAGAFTLSWIITILRIKSVSRKLNDVEKQLKS